MALAWPMCRIPLGSGGNRVRTCEGKGDTSVLRQETRPLPDSRGTDMSPNDPTEPPVLPLAMPPVSCVSPPATPPAQLQPGTAVPPSQGTAGLGTWPHLPTRDCQVMFQQSHGVGCHHVALRLVVLSYGQRMLRAAAQPKPSQAQQPVGKDMGSVWGQHGEPGPGTESVEQPRTWQ